MDIMEKIIKSLEKRQRLYNKLIYFPHECMFPIHADQKEIYKIRLREVKSILSAIEDIAEDSKQ